MSDPFTGILTRSARNSRVAGVGEFASGLSSSIQSGARLGLEVGSRGAAGGVREAIKGGLGALTAVEKLATNRRQLELEEQKLDMAKQGQAVEMFTAGMDAASRQARLEAARDEMRLRREEFETTRRFRAAEMAQNMERLKALSLQAESQAMNARTNRMRAEFEMGQLRSMEAASLQATELTQIRQSAPLIEGAAEVFNAPTDGYNAEAIERFAPLVANTYASMRDTAIPLRAGAMSRDPDGRPTSYVEVPGRDGQPVRIDMVDDGVSAGQSRNSTLLHVFNELAANADRIDNMDEALSKVSNALNTEGTGLELKSAYEGFFGRNGQKLLSAVEDLDAVPPTADRAWLMRREKEARHQTDNIEAARQTYAVDFKERMKRRAAKQDDVLGVPDPIAGTGVALGLGEETSETIDIGVTSMGDTLFGDPDALGVSELQQQQVFADQHTYQTLSMMNELDENAGPQELFEHAQRVFMEEPDDFGVIGVPAGIKARELHERSIKERIIAVSGDIVEAVPQSSGRFIQRAKQAYREHPDIYRDWHDHFWDTAFSGDLEKTARAFGSLAAEGAGLREQSAKRVLEEISGVVMDEHFVNDMNNADVGAAVPAGAGETLAGLARGRGIGETAEAASDRQDLLHGRVRNALARLMAAATVSAQVARETDTEMGGRSWPITEITRARGFRRALEQAPSLQDTGRSFGLGGP